MSGATKSPPRRRRRTAAEARAEILDAAEARLREGGPEAMRLQEIAADVGISHPTILHHFQSRDGLVRALGLRITERLVNDLLEALADGPAEPQTADHLIEHVFTTLNDSATVTGVSGSYAKTFDANWDFPSIPVPPRGLPPDGTLTFTWTVRDLAGNETTSAQGSATMRYCP